MTIKPVPSALATHEIERKLEGAETASLLLALVEVSGDVSLLERWGHHIAGPSSAESVFPADVEREIRARAARAFPGPEYEPQLLQHPEVLDALANHVAGRRTSEVEKELILKEMGLLPEAYVNWTVDRPRTADGFSVVIVGAGLSGIATAIHLKRMDIPFVIYDKNDAPGGTWLVNVYPGCGVDIASHYFSYSFARKPDWTRYYAKQPEILEYIQDCVETFGLREHIVHNAAVESAIYDESAAEWEISVHQPDGSRQRKRANVLVSGVGQLSVPLVPELEGRERFNGHAFHCADWETDLDLSGKRVVLVGNGASANQIGPAIAPVVEHLAVLARSPQWVSGVPGYLSGVAPDTRWVLTNLPPYERWFRVRTMMSMNDGMRPAATIDPTWAGPEGTVNAANEQLREHLVAYMKDELGDRQDLLPKLVPDFPPMMKRMLRDNGWPRMFRRDNVTLGEGGAAAFTEDGVLDEAGNKHKADVVVFATGFRAARMLSSFEIIGRDGVSIREAWGEEDPRAYLGITVPQFPNLFVLYGPNTNVGVGGSIFFQAEAQSGYIAKMIREMVEAGVASVEVRRDVFEDYNFRMDAELDKMIWALPLGTTWYRNSKGRVTANMPWTSTDYWDMTRKAGLEEYHVAQRLDAIDSAAVAEQEKLDRDVSLA